MVSRSSRKTPIIGRLGGSDKQCKRRANRRLRRGNKEQPEKDPKLMREKNNMWNFAKDGKVYFSTEEFPEGMRK